MPTDNGTATSAPDPSPRAPAERPLAIQVEELKKAFRIPMHRVDSIKERAMHPFANREYRELQALDGISFDVHQGEFFGIVGRNGSGKSTLLKLLASIYKSDAGTIRLAGRLAPFIELGVGFNVELTARENVALNGVMMGLTPKDARDRLDAILEFAELEQFVDLKLKNYSSGMLVRLAFSVMLQADADVLLIDEVLAVGDAAFQQKCADEFRKMKAAGKTIVLVTHEMATVEAYCHRAMLINDGRIQGIGDPKEIARQYLRLNFEDGGEPEAEDRDSTGDGVRLLDAWIEDEAGERATSVEQGDPIRIRAEIEVVDEAEVLGIGFVLANADGLGIFTFDTPVKAAGGAGDRLAAGQRVRVSAQLQNQLVPGRYFVHCGVQRYLGDGEDAGLYTHNALDFVVFGERTTHGVVSLPYEIEASLEDAGDGR
jgi:ABC-type polysaccharide/polyol phosphate transport system ATPase subunit